MAAGALVPFGLALAARTGAVAIRLDVISGTVTTIVFAFVFGHVASFASLPSKNRTRLEEARTPGRFSKAPRGAFLFHETIPIARSALALIVAAAFAAQTTVHPQRIAGEAGLHD